MKKKPLVLIVCIVVVIIALILLVIYLAGGGEKEKKDVINSNSSNVQPKIEFSIEPEDTTDSTVTILAEASIGGGASIESITLPNGQVVTSSSAKYEVTKNGEYSFIVSADNGSNLTQSITIDNISEISAYSPYIPSGFTHVADTEVETGYVIEDENGNQFVWVPVESGSLIRNTDGNEQYEESDYTATGLYNSVAKYYGFYIAKYEASRENVNGLAVAKSVEGAIPWSNVIYEDAYNASVNAATAYDYTGVKTALMNSYAWDSTLNWINQSINNYSSTTSYGNYTGTILATGTTTMDTVNNICDLAGNLREWTTEIYYANLPEENIEENNNNNNQRDEEEIEEPENYRVVRGGSANINKVANSHIGQPESLSDTYWGFRMILYKD